VTLSIFGIALVVRIGRDAVAGVLSEPHVTAARARGESLRHIVRHHVLRNASIPVVTVLAIYIGELMGGAIIVEELFRLPGLGQAALLAINGRDYPVVQILVLFAATAFVVMNMLADFAYGVIDPRIRRTAKV
jgi:peptide/nickel transport system permease protein